MYPGLTHIEKESFSFDNYDVPWPYLHGKTSFSDDNSGCTLASLTSKKSRSVLTITMYRGFTYMEKRHSVMTTQDVPWPHSHRKRVVQFWQLRCTVALRTWKTVIQWWQFRMYPGLTHIEKESFSFDNYDVPWLYLHGKTSISDDNSGCTLASLTSKKSRSVLTTQDVPWPHSHRKRVVQFWQLRMYPGLTHIEKESFSFDNSGCTLASLTSKKSRSVLTTQDVPWPHSHRKRVVQFWQLRMYPGLSHIEKDSFSFDNSGCTLASLTSKKSRSVLTTQDVPWPYSHRKRVVQFWQLRMYPGLTHIEKESFSFDNSGCTLASLTSKKSRSVLTTQDVPWPHSHRKRVVQFWQLRMYPGLTHIEKESFSFDNSGCTLASLTSKKSRSVLTTLDVPWPHSHRKSVVQFWQLRMYPGLTHIERESFSFDNSGCTLVSLTPRKSRSVLTTQDVPWPHSHRKRVVQFWQLRMYWPHSHRKRVVQFWQLRMYPGLTHIEKESFSFDNSGCTLASLTSKKSRSVLTTQDVPWPHSHRKRVVQFWQLGMYPGLTHIEKELFSFDNSGCTLALLTSKKSRSVLTTQDVPWPHSHRKRVVQFWQLRMYPGFTHIEKGSFSFDNSGCTLASLTSKKSRSVLTTQDVPWPYSHRKRVVQLWQLRMYPGLTHIEKESFSFDNSGCTLASLTSKKSRSVLTTQDVPWSYSHRKRVVQFWQLRMYPGLTHIEKESFSFDNSGCTLASLTSKKSRSVLTTQDVPWPHSHRKRVVQFWQLRMYPGLTHIEKESFSFDNSGCTLASLTSKKSRSVLTTQDVPWPYSHRKRVVQLWQLRMYPGLTHIEKESFSLDNSGCTLASLTSKKSRSVLTTQDVSWPYSHRKRVVQFWQLRMYLGLTHIEKESFSFDNSGCTLASLTSKKSRSVLTTQVVPWPYSHRKRVVQFWQLRMYPGLTHIEKESFSFDNSGCTLASLTSEKSRSVLTTQDVPWPCSHRKRVVQFWQLRMYPGLTHIEKESFSFDNSGCTPASLTSKKSRSVLTTQDVPWPYSHRKRVVQFWQLRMYPGLTPIDKESFSFDNSGCTLASLTSKKSRSVLTTQDVPWPHSHRRRVVQFWQLRMYPGLTHIEKESFSFDNSGCTLASLPSKKSRSVLTTQDVPWPYSHRKRVVQFWQLRMYLGLTHIEKESFSFDNSGCTLALLTSKKSRSVLTTQDVPRPHSHRKRVVQFWQLRMYPGLTHIEKESFSFDNSGCTLASLPSKKSRSVLTTQDVPWPHSHRKSVVQFWQLRMYPGFTHIEKESFSFDNSGCTLASLTSKKSRSVLTTQDVPWPHSHRKRVVQWWHVKKWTVKPAQKLFGVCEAVWCKAERKFSTRASVPTGLVTIASDHASVRCSRPRMLRASRARCRLVLAAKFSREIVLCGHRVGQSRPLRPVDGNQSWRPWRHLFTHIHVIPEVAWLHAGRLAHGKHHCGVEIPDGHLHDPRFPRRGHFFGAKGSGHTYHGYRVCVASLPAAPTMSCHPSWRTPK